MRDQIIRIRASRDEATAMKDLAAARGLSLSELVRRAALGVRMPARFFDATPVALLTQTLGELGRVGGNINQLTRRANAGKLSGHDAELAASLAELDALRGRLREIIR
ncbi:plasmid mobilization protein [Agrobacterium pusense]|uniref:plasmid mobilization protein n=1 Tax=Agrobacterium pusense TaxID=648995 RepID=UPI00289B0FBF|nr:plasmid mobilization relaxosome protein MobC [Agrobacterium pusense]